MNHLKTYQNSLEFVLFQENIKLQRKQIAIHEPTNKSSTSEFSKKKNEIKLFLLECWTINKQIKKKRLTLFLKKKRKIPINYEIDFVGE